MRQVDLSQEFRNLRGEGIIFKEEDGTPKEIFNLKDMLELTIINTKSKEADRALKVYRLGRKIQDVEGSIDFEDAEFELAKDLIKENPNGQTDMILGQALEMMEVHSDGV